MQVVQSTQQQKLVADVISFPAEDLFVVYRGVNAEGAFSLDVRVNPLIGFVWVGFALLMVGSLLSLFADRGPGAAGTSAGGCGEGARETSASALSANGEAPSGAEREGGR